MSLWEKVKKDLRMGLREGVSVVREGAAVVRKKAEELSDEGKKHYALYDLKTKVKKELAELGGTVYDLSAKVKNPLLTVKAKTIMNRIRKLELKISKLEGEPKKPAGKKPAVRSRRQSSR